MELNRYLFNMKTILEQNEGKKVVYHIMCDGQPIDTFDSEKDAQNHLDIYKKDHPGKQLIIEKGVYDSHDHMIDKLDEMCDKLEEEKDNKQNMKRPIVGSLAEAVLHAKSKGIKKFKINESVYDTDECWKNMEEEEGIDDEGVEDDVDLGDMNPKYLPQETGNSVNVDEDDECHECGGSNMNELEDEFFNDNDDHHEDDEVTCPDCSGLGLNEKGSEMFPQKSFNDLLDDIDDDTLDQCACDRCNGEGRVFRPYDIPMDEQLDENDNSDFEENHEDYEDDNDIESYLNSLHKIGVNRKEKSDDDLDEMDDFNLEKGKKYHYKTPSFEDDIEFDDETEYDRGEPMYKFKGQKGDTHLLGKEHIKHHVNEDKCPECGEEVCECGSGMYENDSPHNEWWNTLQSDDQQTHMGTHFPDNEFGVTNNHIKQIYDKIHGHHHKGFMPNVDLGKSFSKMKSMNESKKRTVRLTETQMKEFIAGIIKESGIPSVTKRAQAGSKKENDQNIVNVNHKMKDYLSFEEEENEESVPEPIEKGKKNKDVVKINNTEKEDQIVADNRGYGLQHLDYDYEPSEQFKQRLKDALEGSSKMGNSHDAANVIKTDTGTKILKNAERKKKQVKDQPMYEKDVQPVKVVKENEISQVILEEMVKMKKLSNYNQKTQ